MAFRQSTSPTPDITTSTVVEAPAPAELVAQPTRHIEIETKLEIDDATVLPTIAGRPSTSAVGLISATEPTAHELDAIYFDTSEFDLLAAKLTLRRRTGGTDAGWHLKLPAVAGARTEVCLPLGAGDHDPLSAEVPAALMDLVLGAARGKSLHPVARIRNRRTVVQLLDSAGAAMIEVADDQVTATTLIASETATSGLEESSPTYWRELEVEILDGNRDQLAAVVQLLQAAGATAAASASKLARALAVPFLPHERRPGRR